jgi:Chaperone of endosialidase
VCVSAHSLGARLLCPVANDLHATGGLNPPPDGGYPNANTAEGDEVLLSLTTGDSNTALGFRALKFNTTGRENTACGRGTLRDNTTGSFNTAIGIESLINNTTGSDNQSIGEATLQSNIDGNDNLGVGDSALVNNTSGDQNLGVGTFAGGSTTGSRNTSLGFDAGINADTGSNNIDIGNQGVAGESNTIRIGQQVAVAPVLPPDYPYSHADLAAHTATYIAGISGVAVSGSAVVVSSSGQLGVKMSSERYKDEIKPMDKASEAILALKPVTFRYKKGIDPDHAPQFGLVAEQVEKVNPDLVERDANGKPFTVRYEAVNAMLLNEFLKEHHKVEQQQKEIGTLRGELEQQRAELKEQRAFIQRISDKVEMNRPAPQMVLNDKVESSIP